MKASPFDRSAGGDRVLELLHERVDLVAQLDAPAVEVVIQADDRARRREPLAGRRERLAQGPTRLTRPRRRRPVRVHDHDEVQRHGEELRLLRLEVRVPAPQQRVDGGMRMRVVRSGDAVPLEHVLIEPRPLIPEPERHLEAGRHRLPLLGIEALVVHALKGEHDAEGAALGQEHAVVDEPVERDQVAHRPGVPIVLRDLREPLHRCPSRLTATYETLPGSYRGRAVADRRTIRRSCGSRCVTHRALTIQREKHQQPAEQAAEERERGAADDERDEEQPPVGAANRQRPIDRGVDRLQARRGHGLRETATP